MAAKSKYQFPFAQYPAIRIALLVIIGILLSRFLMMDLHWIVLIVSSSLLLSFAFQRWMKAKLDPLMGVYVTIFYLILIVGLGWMRGAQTNPEMYEAKEVTFLSPFEDEQLIWHGKVTDAHLNANRTLSLFMNIDSVSVNENIPAFKHPFKTQIRFFGINESILDVTLPGSHISVNATSRTIPEKRNPEDFDVKSWLNGQGIYIQANGVEILSVNKNPTILTWGWWRTSLRNGIETVFAPDQSELAKAIMIGYKAGLEREVRQNFSRAGLAHIMAVSGMHVGFVLFPLWLLIPTFWNLKYGKWLGLFIIVFVLFMYAGITGFTPSVQRASVFAFFIAIARLFQKRSDTINLTGVAALVILVIDPQSLFAVGFIMSFTAVLVIFTTLPIIQGLFPPKVRYTFWAKTTQLVMISIAIQLALFPILVDLFQEFSLVGPILNTIAAPITQVLFIWGFIATALGYWLPEIASFLNYPSNFMVYLLDWLTGFSAALPGSYLTLSLKSGWLYAVWFSLFAFLASMYTPAIRWKWALILLIFTGIYSADVSFKTVKQSYVKITFFDVGQGDAVLIQTPSGKNILYDTGMFSPFGNSGERVLLPHLRARGITKLDAVILSHPHADHIGGIITLIENIQIDVIYDSGFQYHSNIFMGYRVAASRNNIPVIEAKAGDLLDICPYMKFLALGPLPAVRSTNPNEQSLVVKVVYGEDRLLLTGDAEHEAERELANTFGDFLRADLLKAGHHGSRTSSQDYFLEVVQPKKTIVSNALNNRYNHPHPEATARIHQNSESVRFTALEGAIKYKLTGRGIERIEWR